MKSLEKPRRERRGTCLTGKKQKAKKADKERMRDVHRHKKKIKSLLKKKKQEKGENLQKIGLEACRGKTETGGCVESKTKNLPSLNCQARNFLEKDPGKSSPRLRQENNHPLVQRGRGGKKKQDAWTVMLNAKTLEREKLKNSTKKACKIGQVTEGPAKKKEKGEALCDPGPLHESSCAPRVATG